MFLDSGRFPAPNRLVLATTNPGKIPEFQSALVSLSGWTVVSQPASVPPIDETGTTFIENAILKAVHTSRFVDDLTLADDSGLCIDALDGRPGVYSARYANTDTERIDRVLTEMAMIPDNHRTAAFVCALALAQRGSVLWTIERKVEGAIGRERAGTNGFGYDPIFIIPKFQRTRAELTMAEKTQISHRGRALRELADFLRSA